MLVSDLTVAELFHAYYDCRKTKRNTVNALRFESNLESNLMDLYYDLINNKYAPGKSICFIVLHPKPREVWAADFRDRIVHHILYNRYSQKFYNSFIHDSYACIPGKGTLRAVQRLEHFARSASENYSKSLYYLKADVANFFVSINKTILLEQLSRKITDPWWFELVKIIVNHDPKSNVYVKSDAELIKKVPSHKSLFNCSSDCGLPIGNLSSQFFANVYLNDLDQFVKHKLKCKYYVRYVDDVVILDNDGSRLFEVFNAMSEYVSLNLAVKFHPNKCEINKFEHGVNFVGYIVKPYRKYIRRSTINTMYGRIDNPVKELKPTINSYLGMMVHCNAFNERNRVKERMMGNIFDNDIRKMIK